MYRSSSYTHILINSVASESTQRTPPLPSPPLPLTWLTVSACTSPGQPGPRAAVIALSESDRLNLSCIIHPLNLLPMRARRWSSAEGTEGRKSGVSSAHIPSSPPSCAAAVRGPSSGSLMEGGWCRRTAPLMQTANLSSPPLLLLLLSPSHRVAWSHLFSSFFSPPSSLLLHLSLVVREGEVVVTEGVSHHHPPGVGAAVTQRRRWVGSTPGVHLLPNTPALRKILWKNSLIWQETLLAG